MEAHDLLSCNYDILFQFTIIFTKGPPNMLIGIIMIKQKKGQKVYKKRQNHRVLGFSYASLLLWYFESRLAWNISGFDIRIEPFGVFIRILIV